MWMPGTDPLEDQQRQFTADECGRYLAEIKAVREEQSRTLFAVIPTAIAVASGLWIVSQHDPPGISQDITAWCGISLLVAATGLSAALLPVDGSIRPTGKSATEFVIEQHKAIRFRRLCIRGAVFAIIITAALMFSGVLAGAD